MPGRDHRLVDHYAWELRVRGTGCETDVSFRVIVGDHVPDFRTISEYRRRHLGQFQQLFLEVLRLCRESGLLKVGRLSLDGIKIKANASRHKSMSYERMTIEENRRQAEIQAITERARAADDMRTIKSMRATSEAMNCQRNWYAGDCV